MRFKAFIVGLTSFIAVGFAQYVPDELGKSFLKRTIQMPDDYEGKVVCTLIKRQNPKPTGRAILYVHGYNDYFFQVEMANRFTQAGYNFYAVDLRKYGRSLLKGQFPTNARNLNEYFADIDSSISLIKGEGNKQIFLIGHSTGGLINLSSG